MNENTKAALDLLKRAAADLMKTNKYIAELYDDNDKLQRMRPETILHFTVDGRNVMNTAGGLKKANEKKIQEEQQRATEKLQQEKETFFNMPGVPAIMATMGADIFCDLFYYAGAPRYNANNTVEEIMARKMRKYYCIEFERFIFEQERPGIEKKPGGGET